MIGDLAITWTNNSILITIRGDLLYSIRITRRMICSIITMMGDNTLSFKIKCCHSSNNNYIINNTVERISMHWNKLEWSYEKRTSASELRSIN